MGTEVLMKKLNKEVEELRDDLHGIKEFLFAPMRDADGEYKDAFVKKMLARSQRLPQYRFGNKESFLKHVRGRKVARYSTSGC